MAGGGRHRAAPARTVDAVRSAEVPASRAGAPPQMLPGRRAGAQLRTGPASRPGTPPGVAPVRRPLMARAGAPQGIRVAVAHRHARVTRPAGPHALPPETDHGAGPPRTANPGPADLPQAASIAAAPGPQTTAGFALLAVRPAKT